MTTFQDLGLEEALLQGIAALGFDTPTPVQELVIPTALQTDEDFIALAQTGTGKTAAFGLPLLQRIDPAEKNVQALVLCPTRELCVQVAADLENYSKYAHQYKVVAVYGGASIDTQIRKIKAGAQIIVATPGRLVDLLVRQVARLDKVARIVLDEADEMLNMGFKDAVDLILEAVDNRQSIWLFSATMPQEVRSIASTYMRNPLELSVGQRNQINADIEHQYFLCHSADRYSALKRIVDATPGIYGLVFCRTKNDTKEVAEQMIRDGYNADALHGDLAQPDRDRVMQRFRERNLQLLIATDVAARGIDVSDISHVINYGLPDEIEVYTHRSGRTGRAGRKGISLSIITPKYEEKIRQIERRSKTAFAKMQIPTGYEVCEKQLFHIIRNIHDQEVKYDEIEPFMPRIYAELEDLSKEELIKRFASVEFNRFLSYYRNAPDINLHQGGKGKKNGSRQSDSASGGAMQRLFVNIGLMDGVNKKDFLQLLTREFQVPKPAIGGIDIKKSYMHFDIDPGFIRDVRKGLEEFDINGRRVKVNEAMPREEKGGGKSFKKFAGKKGKPKRM
ncbi:MAG: DEAD/DEAH box helicase [Saprospiraceae bacterium]|nr:DEAD/DEAH box helicase [Saprospiraceae bacterium]